MTATHPTLFGGCDRDSIDLRAGIPAGSQILTLAGQLPVEHLVPGDRIITRNGARSLANVAWSKRTSGTPIIHMSQDALGGRPNRDTWLLPDQPILVRDWRAQALWGVAQARVPAARLVDGDYVRHGALTEDTTVFHLIFDAVEIVYVDGLELASNPRVSAPV